MIILLGLRVFGWLLISFRCSTMRHHLMYVRVVQKLICLLCRNYALAYVCDFNWYILDNRSFSDLIDETLPCMALYVLWIDITWWRHVFLYVSRQQFKQDEIAVFREWNFPFLTKRKKKHFYRGISTINTLMFLNSISCLIYNKLSSNVIHTAAQAIVFLLY